MGYELIASTVIAWILAQIIKSAIKLAKGEKTTFNDFFGTGGMPSSHSAAVSAMAISCLLNYGANSFQFAISFLLAGVVIHDACGIRKESGRHAKAINDILKEKRFNEMLGHSITQVIFGMLLGIVTAVLTRILFS